MNNDMIEEYPYIHDNLIISYQVIISDRITIYTRYFETEETVITFRGLCAHHFKHVTYENRITNIYQASIDYFVGKYKELLEDGLRCAFPIFALSSDLLCEYLLKEELKVFIIDSSIGLSGFIIAKGINIERTIL